MEIPERAPRTVIYRGERLGSREFARFQRAIDSRHWETITALAEEICSRFRWRGSDGHLSVTPCRLLLVRLSHRGLIRLPFVSRRRVEAPKSILPPCEDFPATKLEIDGIVEVRPIRRDEYTEWRLGMERYHYLGCGRFVGESLRYVASVGGERVALLGWAASALHNGPRDQYIGWDPRTKSRNLRYVINNVRFLIFPWIKVKNIASQILSINLRRLAHDFEVAFHHPIVLAETFVDVSRFHGTCYRASNWLHLGNTRGFSRTGAAYQENEKPKAVFVYPLVRNASTYLKNNPAPSFEKEEPIKMKFDLKRIPIDGEKGLLNALRKVSDPRKRRGMRHDFIAILAIAVCATLAGSNSIRAMAEWAKDQSTATLKRLLCRKGKPPSESTIWRLLHNIDAQQLDKVVGEWLKDRGLPLPMEGIAIDGKTLCGSKDGNDRKAFHLVSAVLHDSGIVIAQERVPDKTNEIKSVEPLFQNLNIEGRVVTADALLTQREIARHLVEDKHAHYLFTVKDNQPTLRKDIEDLHLEDFPPAAPNV